MHKHTPFLETQGNFTVKLICAGCGITLLHPAEIYRRLNCFDELVDALGNVVDELSGHVYPDGRDGDASLDYCYNTLIDALDTAKGEQSE